VYKERDSRLADEIVEGFAADISREKLIAYALNLVCQL